MNTSFEIWIGKGFLKWILNTILLSRFLLKYSLDIHLCKLSILFDYIPSTYLLVYNCETFQRFCFFDLFHLCQRSFLFIPITDICKKAKLQARIKPTALCSAVDKENSIEFLLDFLYYLYNYYMVCALPSHAYHVTHHVTL